MQQLLKAEDIAQILQVEPRIVAERYSLHPDFPPAIRLPSPGGHGHRRWKKEEIDVWINSLAAHT